MQLHCCLRVCDNIMVGDSAGFRYWLALVRFAMAMITQIWPDALSRLLSLWLGHSIRLRLACRCRWLKFSDAARLIYQQTGWYLIVEIGAGWFNSLYHRPRFWTWHRRTASALVMTAAAIPFLVITTSTDIFILNIRCCGKFPPSLLLFFSSFSGFVWASIALVSGHFCRARYGGPIINDCSSAAIGFAFRLATSGTGEWYAGMEPLLRQSIVKQFSNFFH